MIRKNLAYAIMFLIIASGLTLAGSITYNQDGTPIFTNGTSSDPASNLNANDSNYYNVDPGTGAGPATLNLPMACKADYIACREGTTNDTFRCNCGTVNTTNAVYPGGSAVNNFLTTTNNGTANVAYVDESLGATTAEVPDGATITSVTATVAYYVSSSGAGRACYIDVWDGTAFTTTTLTCRTGSVATYTYNVTTALNTVGKLRAARLRLRYTADSSTRRLYADRINLTVNYTSLNHEINVTHNSTTNVTPPANHQFVKTEAHIIAKSNDSATPTYTTSWYYSGSFATTGCSAATTLATGSDTDLSCVETTTPSNTIAPNNRMAIRISTDAVGSGFQLNENYVYYKAWFPNLTLTTVAPVADPVPYEDEFFQINCSSSVDADLGISNGNYYLLYSNDSGASWNTLTAASVGLHLNSTTPTNPLTSQSIPAGGNTTNSWYVNAITAGSYQLKCVTNSTTAGEQNSTALPITVAHKSSLVIWDDTDTTTKYPGGQVYFFANYTMANGTIIDATGVCQISFNITGGWTAWANMTYNTSSTPYYYSRSFADAGTFNFNVSCSKPNYAPKNATSTFIISPTVYASVTTGKPSYSGCAINYYRVRFYDSGGFLTNTIFDVKVTDPSATQVQSLLSLSPNNGTGVYLGSYKINSTAQTGTWLINAVISGISRQTAPFSVIP